MVEYEEADSEITPTKGNAWKTFKLVALPLLLILLMYYLYGYRTPTFATITDDKGKIIGNSYPVWQVWGLIIFLGYELAVQLPNIMRNLTPKIVYSDGFSTTNGRIIPAGNFCIVRAGAIRAPGIESPGGSDGLRIFPKSALNWAGRNIYVNAELRPTPWPELPLDVRIKMKAYGLTKFKPWLYGNIDPSAYLLDNISLSDDTKKILAGSSYAEVNTLRPEEFDNMVRLANRQQTVYEKVGDSALSKLEKVSESIAAIGNTDNFIKSAFKAVKGERKEEE